MDRNSKEFKDLQKKWYSKLAKAGFEDIEQEDGHLSIYVSSTPTRYPSLSNNKAKEEYYQLAGQFLYDYKFKNAFEKFAWKNHSDGISIREIVKLFKARGMKTNKQTVHTTVKRLATIMLKGSANG